MSEPESLRIVLFRDGDLWVGSFIEYWIVAQGGTWEEALTQTKLAIVEQAKLDDNFETTPLSNCQPAPEDLCALFTDPEAEELPKALVDAIPVKSTSRFVNQYLGNLTVKKLDRDIPPH